MTTLRQLLTANANHITNCLLCIRKKGVIMVVLITVFDFSAALQNPIANFMGISMKKVLFMVLIIVFDSLFALHNRITELPI